MSVFPAALVEIDTVLGNPAGFIKITAQMFVQAGGYWVATELAEIADHGSGAHNAATIKEGSVFVRIAGFPVAMEGSAATCNHVVTGSSHVRLSS